MKTYNLFKEQCCNHWSIIGGVARNKVCHLAESINHHHDRIFSPLGPWQSHNKIHTQILPRLTWNRKRGIQAFVKSGLSLMTARTSSNNSLYIFHHRRPMEMFIQNLQGLCNAKMTSQSSPMCFSNQQVSNRAFWNTQSTILEKESILNNICSLSLIWGRTNNRTKVWISFIQFLDE